MVALILLLIALVNMVKPTSVEGKPTKGNFNSTENISYSSHDIIVAVIHNLLLLGRLELVVAHSSIPRHHIMAMQDDHQAQDNVLSILAKLTTTFYCFAYLLCLYYFFEHLLVSYLLIWHFRHFPDSNNHTETSQ